MSQNPIDPPSNDPYDPARRSLSGATTTGTTTTGSRTDEAREQGRQAADTAKGEARNVAETAKDQAGRVADEARQQGRNLVHEARDQARHQAQGQTDRAAHYVRDVAGSMQALAEGRPEDAGAVGDYARQATEQIQRFADRIEQRGFDGIVADVQSFARRRPGAFLLTAAVAGFATGRLLRGARDASGNGGSTTGTTPPYGYTGQYTGYGSEYGRDYGTPSATTPTTPAATGYPTSGTVGETPYTEPGTRSTQEY